MNIVFDVRSVSYAVDVPVDAFSCLMDSESYVTGNAAFQTGNLSLSDKLDRLVGVSECDYSGHYGAHIFFNVDSEFDGEEKHKEISGVILEHLLWCATVPKLSKFRLRG